MWLDALELCLVKLKCDGIKIESLSCISGCAQRHGSVWWTLGASQVLRDLDPTRSLFDDSRDEQQNVFSMDRVAIWADSSTSEECRKIEAHSGGSTELARITGCRAFERFTASHIAKICNRRHDIYEQTERITLISNFLSTILVGSYTPFDVSDAAGMNMMDIRKKRWSEICLAAILNTGAHSDSIEGLKAKLGCSRSGDDENIVDSDRIIGEISSYFIKRFGFSSECLISSFTGDTPTSMAGLGVTPDQLLISLGTSDTSCFFLKEPIIKSNGHISICPFNTTQYVGMMSFKNGSKTRERIRDKFASCNWNEFTSLLNKVPAGNKGNVAFYFDMREIYPLCEGDYRFDAHDKRLAGPFQDPALEIRACLEGQVMRLHNHLAPYLSSIRQIICTGGASINKSFLQVVADVFGMPVKAMHMPDSACLGAAYMARYAWEIARNTNGLVDQPTFDDVILSKLHRSAASKSEFVYPQENSHIIYRCLMERYRNLENHLSSYSIN